MQLGAVTAKMPRRAAPRLVVIMSVPRENRDVECRYVEPRFHNDPRLARANTRRIRAIEGESIIRALNIFALPSGEIPLHFFSFMQLDSRRYHPRLQLCRDFFI